MKSLSSKLGAHSTIVSRYNQALAQAGWEAQDREKVAQVAEEFLEDCLTKLGLL